MIVLRVRNVHTALYEGIKLIKALGVPRESRNGKVLVFPEPVTTVYERPLERVVFWPTREANPFFHFAESLWMLAGRNDVSYLTSFVPRMRDFSDNGETFHGAYGHRWRNHFGYDQLREIIVNLRNDTTDRRQVLQMWDANTDLVAQKGKKDLPCNTQAIFSVTHEGRVDMMVTNRSNDMILGAYGANAVHFSYLHEFVARALSLPVGVYRQVSNNLHAYQNSDWDKVEGLSELEPWTACVYEGFVGDIEGPAMKSTIYSLISGTDYEDWLQQLSLFLSKGAQPGMDPFFRRVADPILRSHAYYQQRKDKDRYVKALDALDSCVDGPWMVACKQWIGRRMERAAKLQQASDDGVKYE